MDDDYRVKAVEQAVREVVKTFDPEHSVPEAVADEVIQKIIESQELRGSQRASDAVQPYKIFRWAAGLYFTILLRDLGRCDENFLDHTACNGKVTKTLPIP